MSIGVDCIKIGMLHTEEIITEVRKTLAIYTPDIPIVLDPVMVAKGVLLLEGQCSGRPEKRINSNSVIDYPKYSGGRGFVWDQI